MFEGVIMYEVKFRIIKWGAYPQKPQTWRFEYGGNPTYSLTHMIRQNFRIDPAHKVEILRFSDVPRYEVKRRGKRAGRY